MHMLTKLTKMTTWIKQHKVRTLAAVLALVVIGGLLPYYQQATLKFRIVSASGTADYTVGAGAAQVQIQAAVNALPAGGGEIDFLSGTFALTPGSATITRAIDNITIVGVGRGTYFTNNAATAIFTAGGNNWVFQNLRTDAGGINMGATTGWSWRNVTVNATYYTDRTPADGNITVGSLTSGSVTDSGLTSGRVTYAGAAGILTDEAGFEYNAGTNTLTSSVGTFTTGNVTTLNAPTGRAADAVIAPANATALDRSQADVVLLGAAGVAGVSDDGTVISSYLVGGGRSVRILAGDVYPKATISIPGKSHLAGAGATATWLWGDNAINVDMLTVTGGSNSVQINDMNLNGKYSTGQVAGSGIKFTDSLRVDIAHVTTANFPEYGIYGASAAGGNQVYFNNLDGGQNGLGGIYLVNSYGFINGAWSEYNVGPGFNFESNHKLTAVALYSNNNGTGATNPGVIINNGDSNYVQATILGPGGHGTLIKGTANNNTVYINVTGAGQAANNTYSGVYIADTAHSNSVTVTTVSSANPYQKYGVYEEAGAYDNAVLGGSISGAATAPYLSVSNAPFRISPQTTTGIASTTIGPQLAAQLYGAAGTLTALWPMKEISGTSVTDASGNGYTLTANKTLQTYTGLPTFIGTLPAYQEGGVANEGMSIADAAWQSLGSTGLVDAPYSIQFVAKPTTSASSRVVIGKWTAAGNKRQYQIGFDGTTNKLSLEQYDQSAGVGVFRTTDAAVDLTEPHVYTIVSTNTNGAATAMNNVTIYTDGVVTASTATNDGAYVAMEVLTGNLEIGSVNVDTASYYKGLLGAIVMYPKALSATEVAQTSNYIRAAGGF